MLDLAEYAAWKSSPFVGTAPPRVHLLYAAALQWLEAVARGGLVLPAASPPNSTTAADDTPRGAGAARVFTADELDGL